MDNAVPDFGKWLPGWTDYHAWAVKREIFDKLNNGEIAPADIAQELEESLVRLFRKRLKSEISFNKGRKAIKCRFSLSYSILLLIALEIEIFHRKAKVKT